MEKVPLATE